MRAAVVLLIAGAAIAGCTTVKHQVTDANVAARYDSTKSAAEFARCAAAALGSDFRMEEVGSTAFALIRQQGILTNARWDFFPTNSGSQAELRSGSKDGAGADKVLACA